MPPVTVASHMGSWLSPSCSSSQQRISQVLGTLCWHGTPRRNHWLLALMLPSFGCYENLRTEPADERFSCALYLSLLFPSSSLSCLAPCIPSSPECWCSNKYIFLKGDVALKPLFTVTVTSALVQQFSKASECDHLLRQTLVISGFFADWSRALFLSSLHRAHQ